MRKLAVPTVVAIAAGMGAGEVMPDRSSRPMRRVCRLTHAFPYWGEHKEETAKNRQGFPPGRCFFVSSLCC